VKKLWTPELDAQILAHHARGLSASRIAMKLAIGASRNAVIGRMHRIGLKGRPRGPSLNKIKATRIRNRVAAQSAPRAAHEPVILPASDDIARVSFLDLESHHCRFIPGDPKSHPSHVPIYCGDTRMPGSSYCAGHHHRCSVPIVRPARPYRPGAPYVSVNSRILEDV
jgi:GcrA cell cycle regulator